MDVGVEDLGSLQDCRVPQGYDTIRYAARMAVEKSCFDQGVGLHFAPIRRTASLCYAVRLLCNHRRRRTERLIVLQQTQEAGNAFQACCEALQAKARSQHGKQCQYRTVRRRSDTMMVLRGNESIMKNIRVQ